MEKTSRVLIMFYRLLHEEGINKVDFAAEYDMTVRSVERYIKEIRAFLKCVNAPEKLLFDREAKTYYLNK